MDYSVYIIYDRTKSNEDILKALAGDTEVGEHVGNMARDLANGVAGADLLDRYATTKALGTNGVAIRGEMIKSVSFKPTLIKKETIDKGSTQVAWDLATIITVTGSLFAPSLIEIKSQAVKNKNMARVAAWASLPKTKSAPNVEDNDIMHNNNGLAMGGGLIVNENKYLLYPAKQKVLIDDVANKLYEKFYYRRVLITVYSNTDTQFRAILFDKVFVDSYEEVFDDKDGNGKFTLVMKSVGANVYDTFVAGPTYTFSKMALVDAVTTAASRLTKTTNKAAETLDHIAGTSFAKDVKNAMDKADSVIDTTDSIKDDVTIENLDEQINDQAETWHPTDVQKAVDQASEYQQAYDKLTPEEKAALKNVPGFDKMSQEDKLDYIEKMQGKIKGDTVEDTIAKAAEYKKAYDALTGKQKKILEGISNFEQMSLKEKLEYLKKVKDEQ